jgi:hypothetical protein
MWTSVRAWAGSGRPGRCKWCRRAVVWVITDKGKHVPFDLGFTVRDTVTHPGTKAAFVVLDRDDRHDCVERRRQNYRIRSQIGEKHGKA